MFLHISQTKTYFKDYLFEPKMKVKLLFQRNIIFLGLYMIVILLVLRNQIFYEINLKI